MAAVISHVLSCCLQRKPSKPKIVTDEESHLIPNETEIVPSYNAAQHSEALQNMKDRMAYIVRVKESKMVDVTSRLPFNIHNKIYLPLEDDLLDDKAKIVQPGLSSASASPSYSRSGSTSSLPPTARYYNHNIHHYTISPSPLSPLSPIHNPKPRHPNLSRSSSMAFNRIADQIYESSSIKDEVENHDQHHSTSGSGSRSRMESSSRVRSPPFRVRLVRGYGTPSTASEGLTTRRGRAKKRTSHDANTAVEAQGVKIPGHSMVNEPEINSTPITQTSDRDNPSLSISPASTSSSSVTSSMPPFKIRNCGPLVMGWEADES